MTDVLQLGEDAVAILLFGSYYGCLWWHVCHAGGMVCVWVALCMSGQEGEGRAGEVSRYGPVGDS